MQLKRITDSIQIDYVATTLIPAVREEHLKTFKKYKDRKWEEIKYSEAFPLWKGVTDVKIELELISNKVVVLNNSDIKNLEDSLKQLTDIPKWNERIQKLSVLVEIFKVSPKTEDWLGRSLKIFRDDILILGKLVEFAKYIKNHNPDDDENYWLFIKELSSSSELLEFLQDIAEHDIKSLINCVDAYSDGQLTQKDTVSSLIQVKQLRNISYGEEVTKEKIQNAVLKGIYTFEKDDKSNKFNITIEHQTYLPDEMQLYNMSDLQNLRELAQLIAKPTNTSTDLTKEKNSRKIMNEFVLQVDTAQEILNVGSKLIQMGHFDYRQFKKEIICTEERFGTTEMKDLLVKLKADLQNWKKVVDEAQEQHYYLTFFRACLILAFYDYFTYVQDNENTEICRTLIKGERVISDVVDRGKLCVASCNDKLRVPNIIMSLYTNHGSYPEPWQILICTKSTAIEELNLFIKRCFFAAKNGYGEKLFCVANLELLELELQYGLVESIRSMCDKHNDYLLALICCREGSFHHHILDQFSQDVHSTNGLNAEAMKNIYCDLCSNIVCVSSDLSGQGKTEWIKQASFEKKKLLRGFLISDGADFGSLVRKFRVCKLQPFESLHINIISAYNFNEINMFLFELLTLKFVSCKVDIASLPNTPVFIEIASTILQKLLNSLPITGYLVKEHLSWNIRNLNVSSEICSPIQIVCNYLYAYDKQEIDVIDIVLHGKCSIKKPLPVKMCQDLIAKYFFEGNTDGVSSFRFVDIFVNVLADQLSRLSSSAYFTVENLKLMIKDETLLRTTLVKTLIDVSKEFATRSLKTKEAQLESTSDYYKAKFEIIQWDVSNHLLVCFMTQNPDSICTLYREINK
ncbi:21782_t:CDS:2, partial [Dentiscutata erythropus]